MPALASGVLNSATLWTLDELPDTEYVQVDDEIVRIAARYPEQVYKPTNETIPDKIRVERGQSGTTAAAHDSGATLTPLYGVGAGGGGGVTVDNTVDDPAEVTTLVAPGATIMEGSATLPSVTLLGPFPIAFNTPGLIDPAENNGIEVVDVPAGSVVEVFVITTAAWAGWEAGDNLVLTLAEDNLGDGPVLVAYGEFPADTPTIARNEAKLFPNLAHRRAIAVVDCKVVAVYWTNASQPITAGSADIYVRIAVPAA